MRVFFFIFALAENYLFGELMGMKEAVVTFKYVAVQETEIRV